MTSAASYWIEHLNLEPHPEGGYFRETYRAADTIEPKGFKGLRNYSTAIYYLLEGTQVSGFHRLLSDEIFHFYVGGTLLVYDLDSDGNLKVHRLGNCPEASESLQAVIQAGHWFGAAVEQESAFSLVGCTVAPGFDFQDFEVAKPEKLAELFPQHQAVIERLTPAR